MALDRPEIPFERTSCACEKDVANCRKRPGPLMPGDLAAIVQYLRGTARTVTINATSVFMKGQSLFRASKGPIISKGGQPYRIGTIVPRMKVEPSDEPSDTKRVRGGGCIFLDEHDRCTIHPVAPFGCAYIDEHMSPEEGNRRSAWAYRQIVADAGYQALRFMLFGMYGYEVEPFPDQPASLRNAPKFPTVVTSR